MERGEVGLGAAVGVGAVLAEDPDTVQVTDFHRVIEVVEGVPVDEGDEADHQGDASVPPLDVGVSALLEQHVEEVVAKLPVRDVAQHGGQGRVTAVAQASSIRHNNYTSEVILKFQPLMKECIILLCFGYAKISQFDDFLRPKKA